MDIGQLVMIKCNGTYYICSITGTCGPGFEVQICGAETASLHVKDVKVIFHTLWFYDDDSPRVVPIPKSILPTIPSFDEISSGSDRVSGAYVWADTVGIVDING